MDKTYTETKGHKAFDWRLAIQRGKAGLIGPASEEQNNINELSRNWVTCACGNMCAIIERNKIGGPEDPMLNMLGVRFYAKICNQSWDEAQNTLNLIEARSAVLVNEKLQQLNQERLLNPT